MGRLERNLAERIKQHPSNYLRRKAQSAFRMLLSGDIPLHSIIPTRDRVVSEGHQAPFITRWLHSRSSDFPKYLRIFPRPPPTSFVLIQGQESAIRIIGIPTLLHMDSVSERQMRPCAMFEWLINGLRMDVARAGV